MNWNNLKKYIFVKLRHKFRLFKAIFIKFIFINLIWKKVVHINKKIMVSY
jgi:hypothetical protein